jgi:hypothetical protein
VALQFGLPLRLLVNVDALREALERRAGEENYRGERVY